MANKELGKIQSIRLGSGGYQGAMFGLSFTLGTDSWGVQDFWGSWSQYPKGAKYSKEDFDKTHTGIYERLRTLMQEARVDDFSKLQGLPVEVEFSGDRWGGTLISWRILKEVL